MADATSDSVDGGIIFLKLTEAVHSLVTKFVIDARSKDKHLVLALNNEYNNKTVISPIFRNWVKTTSTFMEQMQIKEIKPEHQLQLCDIVDNNYEKILGLDGRSSNDDGRGDSHHQEPKQKVFIRKYTGNGLLPLHESVIIAGQPSTFLHLVDHYRPQYTSEIPTSNRIFYPGDTMDTQNPVPYIFKSVIELEEYLKLAQIETYETLHSEVESIFKLYVNAEEHYITVLAADTIYSYFQDKFGTTHYNIFVGDNGSGKNSALLVFKYLGYRVFYITAASAPNYFTFLGDVEEGQGTTAEDESEDIGYDKDKQKIFRTGYCSGATVPKVDLSFRRTQDAYLTYCHKWLAMEALPDYKKIKGVLDRSFVYNFVVGIVPYNIKDVIQHAGDPKLKPLYDQIIHTRKLLFAFRMVHHSDIIPDVDLNVIHRSAELTKPLLRLFSYRKDSAKALERIRIALSKFILKRNELKRNSIESKLRDAINSLITKRDKNPEEAEGLPQYGFYNDQIWSQVKDLMEGIYIIGKSASFYSVEYGTITNRFVSGLYRSKFKADPFRTGSGSETRRGLKFSKEVLDRLGVYYNVPDEIKIGNSSNKNNDDDNDEDGADSTYHSIASEPGNGDTDYDIVGSATFATDATHSGDRHGISEGIPDCRNTKSNENNSIAYTHSSEIYTKSPFDELLNHLNNGPETSSPPSTSVASVASVANIKDYYNDLRKETAKTRDKSAEVGLPAISCLLCDYNDPIEFDLSVHYQEKHRADLVRLPIGKCCMTDRGAYAVELSKKKFMERFERLKIVDNAEEDDDEHNIREGCQ